MATTFPSAAAHPEGERRPDGVAVDLASEPPPAMWTGDAEDKVVTLRTPLGAEVAMRTVRDFFDSIQREDIAAMMQLLTGSALLHNVSVGAQRPVHSAVSLWRQRFRQHDYLALATRLLYREGDITTYRGGDHGLLPTSVRHLGPASAALPTDVVLRVPIVTVSINNQRVLGDTIFFWLRRSADGDFTIYRMAEDVPL